LAPASYSPPTMQAGPGAGCPSRLRSAPMRSLGCRSSTGLVRRSSLAVVCSPPQTVAAPGARCRCRMASVLGSAPNSWIHNKAGTSTERSTLAGQSNRPRCGGPPTEGLPGRNSGASMPSIPRLAAFRLRGSSTCSASVIERPAGFPCGLAIWAACWRPQTGAIHDCPSICRSANQP
jgi:hypothetical protein